MKRNPVIWLMMLVIFFQANAQTTMKKYDIKSGIVTYDQIMKMGKMEIKNKIVVYFDEYGMKECKETYNDGKLEESFFSDGKNIYIVKHAKKAAFKQGEAYRGTELRVEWTEFGSEKDRKSGKIKKLPVMTVAGKTCEMFAIDDGRGSVTQYGGWDKILLYSKIKSKSSESLQKAVKVEENVKVSEEKFNIPTGYTIQ